MLASCSFVSPVQLQCQVYQPLALTQPGCPSYSKCAGLVHVAVRDGQACRDREGVVRGEGGGARSVQRLRAEQQEKKRDWCYRCNPPKEGNAKPVWKKSLSSDFLSLELVCSSILPRTVNVIPVKLTDHTLCIQNLSMMLWIWNSHSSLWKYKIQSLICPREYQRSEEFFLDPV